MKRISKKILIVEDEKDYLSILQKAFTNEGFSIISAQDGIEGYEMAIKENPDLIIIDILLPKMDGITMAKKLKDANVNIPSIFLTNVDRASYISNALGAIDPPDYIVKTDLHINEIVARVKARLGIKS